MRSRFRRFRGAAVLAVILGAAIGVPIIVTSHPAPSSGVAHLWISPSGNDSTCARSASLLTYAQALTASPTAVCTTGPKAYQKANLGDTVLTETMTVTAQWNFATANNKTGTAGTCNYNYGGTANLASCVTIKPDTGQTLTFNVAGTSSTAIRICTDFLALQNFTVTPTTYQTVTNGTTITVTNGAVGIGAGDSTCQPGSAPPHDIYIAAFDTPQDAITGGAYNSWYVGGVSHGAIGNPWQLGGQGNNSGTLPVHDSGVVSTSFSNFVVAPPQHFECIHMDGAGNHNTVADDVFIDCPIFAIRVEAEFAANALGGDAQVNHVIENNDFDCAAGTCQSGALNVDCHDNGCSVTGNTFRFNSFHNGTFSPTNDCALVGTNTCTDSGNSFYGNLGGGCPSNATAFGLGWSTAYNVQPGAQSGICAGDSTSAYGATINFVSPGTPNYNLDLNGSQTATGFVPASVTGGWPLTDIHGNVRSGATTNAGAAAGGTPQTGASLASCTGGSCTQGAAISPSSRPSSCSTTPTPTGSGVPTGGWVALGNISDSVQNECRYYAVYVPNGLTGSAPVIVFGHGNQGCLDSTTDIAGDGLDTLANNNKAILVMVMLGWSSTGTACNSYRPSANWFHPNRDTPDPGSNIPQDYTYLQTVISDIEARMTGSLTVDPKRIWYIGGSSGGGLGEGVACDDTTSALFRGITVQSLWDVQSTSTPTYTAIPLSERCGGGSAPASSNKNFFFQFLYAMNAPSAPNGNCLAAPNHCSGSYTDISQFMSNRWACTSSTHLVSGSNYSDTYTCPQGGYRGVVVPGSGDGYSTDFPQGYTMQMVFDYFNNATWTGP